MNLLFAINGGYIPTFLGCMRSVLLHGGASHYEVFILHSDLTDGDEADIRTALPDVDFHFVLGSNPSWPTKKARDFASRAFSFA